jgi:hypothetical protein
MVSEKKGHVEGMSSEANKVCTWFRDRDTCPDRLSLVDA